MPTSVFSFLQHFTARQKTGFIALWILHLAWALDFTLFPYIFKLFMDGILAHDQTRDSVWDTIFFPVALGAGFWIFTDGMFRVYDYLNARIFPQFEANIRTSMTRYVSHHSHDFFASHFAGSVANKISNMTDSATRIMQLTLTLFSPSLVGIAIAVAIFATMHPLFAGLLFVWVALHISTCVLTARRCNRFAHEHAEERSSLTGRIVDSLTNNITVRAFARNRFERRQIDRHQSVEQHKNYTSLHMIAHVRMIQGILCFLMMGVIHTGLMIYLWQHHKLETSELVYIFYTSWNITMMAWISGIELPNLFKEWGICRQGLSIINHPHDITDSPDATNLTVTKGTITFDNVNFHYNKGNSIFANHSFTVEAGQKVGLVGFSGSGKTTLVNLIMRFYDIESGSILIDGQDIRHVTQDSLRQHIAMIPQDPSLFHRSLIENIRYGNPDATDEEVINAAKQAHCHDFIMSLSQGYDTPVGERGIKLSGGQRQRIAIARAILRNAPILILDEATSALDSATERDIQSSLHELMEHRTTIVVAHRLSTLSEMDRILVLSNGEIIEDGDHATLLAQNGHYTKLWHMQAGGFLPDSDEPAE